MKLQQLLPGILLTSSVSVIVATPARADVVQVTGVRLNRTDPGLEIVLETASGKTPQVLTTRDNNSLIIEVLNAQLARPTGEDFRSVDPAEGINSVIVNQFDTNNIRVTITGTAALPEAEVVAAPQGLAINISTPSAKVDTSPRLETPVTAYELSKLSNLIPSRELKQNQWQQAGKSRLSTSEQDLLVQNINSDEIVKVTGINLDRTDEGLQIILETATGQQLVPLIFPEGNNLVIDILDATLALPTGNEFRETNPTPGIIEVSLTQVDESIIRLTITGENNAPSAEVIPSERNLVLGVKSEATAQTEADEEIEIIATGEAEEDDYFVPNATTGTRTDTPIRDIPQSIQVIPRQVLEDQQVIRLDEALRNVSGVTFGGVDQGRGVEFSIRGFDDAPVLRNGFRQYQAQSFPETANLERIEVLKGPAAVLFGEIDPGGLINLVTKRPLSEPFYQIQTQFGNRDLIRPTIDFSGPLTADGRLLYRLNAVYQSSDDIPDFDTDIDRFFISPVLSWQIGDRTDLTLELEYLDEERPSYTGIPAVGDEIADVPFDRVFGEPDDFIEEEVFNIGYELEHRFSDNWRLRNRFRYADQDSLSELAIALEDSLDEETGILNRNWGQQIRGDESFSLQTSVVGDFATGSIDHTLLFGVDLNRTNLENFIRLDFFNQLPLNIFDPVYEAFPRPDFDELPILTNQESETDRLGIFIQDQISFTDNLILLAGLRYDTVEQRITNGPTAFSPDSTDETQNDDAFTPRVGLVYQPIEEVSLYASYSQSFTPNSGTSFEGDFFDPEEGEGFEVGVKTELLDGRLAATLAYFDITKQNVVTADPNNFGFSVATGEQQSQGVELDVIGEILPGWNIIASYAFIDAEVSEDNTIEVGNRLTGIPEHSASLWTTYEIQSGNLQGLGFGLGFNVVGERAGDLDNTYEVDSYFVTNAALFYQRDNWRAAVNFRNLFDIDYIAGEEGNSRVGSNVPGEPFTVVGSISIEF